MFAAVRIEVYPGEGERRIAESSGPVGFLWRFVIDREQIATSWGVYESREAAHLAVRDFCEKLGVHVEGDVQTYPEASVDLVDVE